MILDKSIKILGAYGGKFKHFNSTCIQLNEEILIDAGNILLPLGERAEKISHIFLTHTHFDHFSDLPFLIDTFFEKRVNSINLYATYESIKFLKEYIFNDIIWPDFTKITISNNKPVIKLNVIEFNQVIKIDDISIKAVKNNHMAGSCGFVFTKKNKTFLFTSDTYLSDDLIEEINSNEKITNLIIETSFPSKYEKLAKISKHLTPKLLKEFLSKINRDLNIYINHLKPVFIDEIKKEVELLNIKAKILEDNEVIRL